MANCSLSASTSHSTSALGNLLSPYCQHTETRQLRKRPLRFFKLRRLFESRVK